MLVTDNGSIADGDVLCSGCGDGGDQGEGRDQAGQSEG